MLRLLRVTEGDPPVIFRFTETESETPREVLERARAAVQKAMRGETPAAGVGAGASAAPGPAGSPDGKGKRKSVGGKEGGCVADGTCWEGSTGVREPVGPLLVGASRSLLCQKLARGVQYVEKDPAATCASRPPFASSVRDTGGAPESSARVDSHQ